MKMTESTFVFRGTETEFSLNNNDLTRIPLLQSMVYGHNSEIIERDSKDRIIVPNEDGLLKLVNYVKTGDLHVENYTDLEKLMEISSFYMIKIPCVIDDLDFYRIKCKEDFLRDRFDLLADDTRDRSLIPLTAELYEKIGYMCEDRYDSLFDHDTITHGQIQPMSTVMDLIKKFYSRGIPDDFVLAGGSIISMIFGLQVNDYDIFPVNRDKDSGYIMNQLRVLIKDINVNDFENDKCSIYSLYRTSNAITIDSRSDKIQIIGRLYKSVSEIIYGFDIDCCCIAYDPKTDQLYVTERSLYALLRMRNTFDPERSSTTYEVRLCKYGLKGFSVYITGFDRAMVRYRDLAEFVSRIAVRSDFSITYEADWEALVIVHKDYYSDIVELRGISILLYIEITKKLPWVYSDYNTGRFICSDITHPNAKGNYSSEELIKMVTDTTFNYRGHEITVPPFTFITRDSGAQVCGSFHKTVIDDPELWLKSPFVGLDRTEYRKINETLYSYRRSYDVSTILPAHIIGKISVFTRVDKSGETEYMSFSDSLPVPELNKQYKGIRYTLCKMWVVDTRISNSISYRQKYRLVKEFLEFKCSDKWIENFIVYDYKGVIDREKIRDQSDDNITSRLEHIIDNKKKEKNTYRKFSPYAKNSRFPSIGSDLGIDFTD